MEYLLPASCHWTRSFNTINIHGLMYAAWGGWGWQAGPPYPPEERRGPAVGSWEGHWAPHHTPLSRGLGPTLPEWFMGADFFINTRKQFVCVVYWLDTDPHLDYQNHWIWVRRVGSSAALCPLAALHLESYCVALSPFSGVLYVLVHWRYPLLLVIFKS